ncbi:MAG: PEP-CTERM sorting domain-containing protein [Thiobacillus sp.]
MFNRKTLYQSLAAALLISASTNLYAETFSIALTGVVVMGDEIVPNDYGLTAGESISAVGTFTAASDFLTAIKSTGTFTDLTINLNGTQFTLADASAAPTVTYMDGSFFDFTYTSTAVPGFNSSFQFFDNRFGTWTGATVAAVPEAETYAMMLAGLGLVGFMAAARRRSLKTDAV